MLRFFQVLCLFFALTASLFFATCIIVTGFSYPEVIAYTCNTSLNHSLHRPYQQAEGYIVGSSLAIRNVDANILTRELNKQFQVIAGLSVNPLETLEVINPNRKAPNKAPYVNEAIERPSSTTGFCWSSNSVARKTKTSAQPSVSNLDSLRLFASSHPAARLPIRSLRDELANAFREGDNVLMAAARIPASTRPAIPTGRFSTI